MKQLCLDFGKQCLTLMPGRWRERVNLKITQVFCLGTISWALSSSVTLATTNETNSKDDNVKHIYKHYFLFFFNIYHLLRWDERSKISSDCRSYQEMTMWYVSNYFLLDGHVALFPSLQDKWGDNAFQSPPRWFHTSFIF
jgi:hypothetical protein